MTKKIECCQRQPILPTETELKKLIARCTVSLNCQSCNTVRDQILIGIRFNSNEFCDEIFKKFDIEASPMYIGAMFEETETAKFPARLLKYLRSLI